MEDKQFAITVLGGGPGFTLNDTDLWGLECAVHHGIDSGYLADNRKWADHILEVLGKLRARPEEDT